MEMVNLSLFGRFAPKKTPKRLGKFPVASGLGAVNPSSNKTPALRNGCDKVSGVLGKLEMLELSEARQVGLIGDVHKEVIV